jgi:hypothetical protein
VAEALTYHLPLTDSEVTNNVMNISNDTSEWW